MLALLFASPLVTGLPRTFASPLLPENITVQAPAVLPASEDISLQASAVAATLHSNSSFTIEELRTAAKLAWSVYWDGAPDGRFSGTGGHFDRNVPMCWGHAGAQDGEAWSTVVPNRETNCEETVPDSWAYQGRLRTFGNTAQADADIYYSTDATPGVPAGETVCMVAIAGTDDLGDWVNNIGSVASQRIQSNMFRVGIGFNMYYRLLRQGIITACGAHTTRWVTGHSLGGATTDIMHAYGDAVRSISFGTPKAFLLRGIGGGSTCKRDGTYLTPAISIYSKDVASGWVDPVGAVGVTRGTHCAEEHYRIKKDGDTITFDAMAHEQPRLAGIGAVDSVQGRLIHPMPASYLPWLYPGGVYPA